MTSNVLGVGSQVCGIATLPFQAAPVIVSTSKWIASRHPHARVEKWLKRIDDVIEVVEECFDNIPDDQIAGFLDFLNGFFAKMRELEETLNDKSLTAWYTRKKTGDVLAGFGHNILRSGMTLSAAAKTINMNCKMAHSDTDRQGSRCVKCFPQLSEERRQLNHVVLTWGDLRRQPESLAGAPKPGFKFKLSFFRQAPRNISSSVDEIDYRPPTSTANPFAEVSSAQSNSSAVHDSNNIETWAGETSDSDAKLPSTQPYNSDPPPDVKHCSSAEPAPSYFENVENSIVGVIEIFETSTDPNGVYAGSDSASVLTVDDLRAATVISDDVAKAVAENPWGSRASLLRRKRASYIPTGWD